MRCGTARSGYGGCDVPLRLRTRLGTTLRGVENDGVGALPSSLISFVQENCFSCETFARDVRYKADQW